MDPAGWAVVIGAFFAGLTGLLVATLPLLLQLRKNAATTAVNARATALNTVALVNGAGEVRAEVPAAERVAAAVGALSMTDPVAAAVVLDEARSALAPLLPRDAGRGD